jgi:acetoin:2,6-dichlorophenolindophenol oxidoreductase subunit alpha
MAEQATNIDQSVLIEMYQKAYKTRRFEQRCIELYREGTIRGYLHLYLGEEAIAAGACTAINRDDYIVSTHRGHGHCISKGGDLKLMMAEITGKATGYCRGRGGSMHISSKQDNNLGANGIVGAGIPIGTGAALGIKVRKSQQVVVCFFSDGATNNGVFGESLNLAAVFGLPIIYLIENNHYAVSTPIEYAAKVKDLAQRADGYEVPNTIVDGNDAVAVYTATLQAAEKARQGGGPTVIEAKTYRHKGHHVNDPGQYMDQELLAEWKAKDPTDRLRKYLGGASLIQELDEAIEAELDEAVEFAKNSPEPDVEEFLATIPNF